MFIDSFNAMYLKMIMVSKSYSDKKLLIKVLQQVLIIYAMESSKHYLVKPYSFINYIHVIYLKFVYLFMPILYCMKMKQWFVF